MAVTTLDILNLSHSLKDVCEAQCGTSDCLTMSVRTLLQYNLLQANLQYCRQLGADLPSASAPSKPALIEQKKKQ